MSRYLAVSCDEASGVERIRRKRTERVQSLGRSGSSLPKLEKWTRSCGRIISLPSHTP